MSISQRALGAVATAILGTCACSERVVDPPLEDLGPPSGLIQFETIASGWFGGYARGPESPGWTDTNMIVIADEPAWISFWVRNSWPHDPPPPVPAVDFTTHTVLAVVDAGRIQAAHVEVTELASSDGVLTVRVARSCGDFPVVSWPFQVIMLERHAWDSYTLDLAGDPCAAYGSGGPG
jgi:hypothetical protein